MITMIFDKEKEQMKHLINAKNLLQNFSYKIQHDLNSKNFFENVVSNIKNYETLERMEKYHFENDIKEMREVLHLLYSGLQTDDYIKSKTSKEMIKCCNVFPDNIGKRMIIQISFIPLIDLFYEDLKYKQFIAEKLDVTKVCCGTNLLEDQRDRLFNKKSLSHKKFPKDEDFIDYKMKNDFISNLEEEYTTRKEEIQTALSLLIAQYENSKDINKTILIIGATYWDNKQKVKSEKVMAFKEALEAMAKVFEKEEKDKLNILELLLKSKIEEIITPILIDEINISYSSSDGEEDDNISFKTLNQLSNEQVQLITKIVIIKSKSQLTGIELIDSEKKEDKFEYTFICKIEI